MLRTVKTGADHFAVRDEGSGPVLLLVHGFPLDHTMWSAQLAHFSSRRRVIAPDLRGLGGSSVTSGTVTMEMYADDLARILDELKVTGPVVLCGLSMGGYIAWQFWKRHANRLSGLILCDTRAAADAPEAAQKRHATADRVLKEGTEFLATDMIPKLFAAGTREKQPDVVDATRQVMLRSPPEGVAAALRGMAIRPDVTTWLPEIQLPALLLCGEHDAITPADEMREVARKLPRAEFEVIPEAGHMAPLERFRRVNAAMEAFLERVK